MYNLYYHGGSANHGCEAIVRSTVKILNQAITLYSSSVDEDHLYGVDQLVSIMPDVYTTVNKGDPHYLRCALDHKLHKHDYLFIKYGHQKLVSEVRPGDIWLSIGGDNYCYSGVDKLGYYNRMIHEKGGKTVLWGCSIEPDVLTPAVVKDLKQYELITVRERLSRDALYAAGINDNVVFCADPAFQLDKGALPLHEDSPGTTIGINISPLVMECGNLVLQNYEELVRYILTETDYNIALIPHVVKDGNDDRVPLRYLNDKFNSSRITLYDDHNCLELKSLISQCRMFVGARTHATIAAYSTCVPTLVTGYSIKARGIAKDIFGTDENYVIPVQGMHTPDQLTTAFKWLAANESEIRTHLNAYMPEYKQRAYLAVNALKSL